eukprot:SAG11_NODE_3832_length_2198_cov_1.252978_3_plen_388_part_01
MSGWTDDGSAAGTWSAPTPAGLGENVRQLYVGGQRATRTSVLWEAATPPGWKRATNGYYVSGDETPRSWLNPGTVEFLFKARGYFTVQRCTVSKVSSVAPGAAEWPQTAGAPRNCTVALTRQVSSTRCADGRTFGCGARSNTMWAGDGCNGIFLCDGHPNVRCAGTFGQHSVCACDTVPPPQPQPPPPPGTLHVELKQPCFNNTAMQGTLGGLRLWAIENLHSRLALAPAGTFYHDRSGQAGGSGCRPGQDCLLYKPRQGEDMRSIEVVAPRLEAALVGGALVSAMGEGPRGGGPRPLSGVTISGITFQHVAWRQPSDLDGYAAEQASIFAWGNNTRNGDLIPCQGLDCATIPAAVQMYGVHGVTIENCSFSHLGGAGVSLAGGSHNS